MKNKMAVVIARWDNGNVNTEVVICQDIDEAIEEVKNVYMTEIRSFEMVTWEDTYINEDWTYAQVSFGALRTEILMGDLR